MQQDQEAVHAPGPAQQSFIGCEIKKTMKDGTISTFIVGDISGDQDVDQEDLEILQNIITNTTLGQFIVDRMSQEELLACDINGDGAIDQKDFMLLANHVISKMEHLARTDELTNIDNRRALKEKAHTKITASRQFGTPLCCLIIDIDFFKQFNDLFGHDAGDRVLCHVADALKKNTRSSDIVARFGGEEFIIILDNATLEAAVTVAEKIMDCLRNSPVILEGSASTPTISIGIAPYEETTSYHNLLKEADKALFRAKKSGRNRICTSHDVIHNMEK
ncbi:MAG: diguanylate cyclase [Vulcanimicrobiota bacterium]